MGCLNLLCGYLTIKIWRGSDSDGRDSVVNHRISFVKPFDFKFVVAFRDAISLRRAYNEVIMVLKGQRHVTLRYCLARFHGYLCRQSC